MINPDQIRALLFGLEDDLALELLLPLSGLCTDVQSVDQSSETTALKEVADSQAQIIFCGPSVAVVKKLRQARPDTPVVVVTRHPEVNVWLDSIEAGATDYCAAPFESSQVRWILESSLRSQQAALPH